MLAPFLGSFYGQALEAGELTLRFDESGFFIAYYDLRFPLRLETYLSVLARSIAPLGRRLGEEAPDYLQLLGVMYVLKTLPGAPEFDERRTQVRFIKQTLWSLYRKNPAIREAIEEASGFFNGRAGDPESFNPLENLLTDQWFRLSYWKVATEEINYRRFFSINDLISLQHGTKRRSSTTPTPWSCAWPAKGFSPDCGRPHRRPLRPGGLPGAPAPGDGGLCTRSSRRSSPRQRPSLPGRSRGPPGYDFLNEVNGVFCKTDGEGPLSRVYTRFTGMEVPFDALVYEKKKLIIEKHMFGDINNLAHLLKNIAGRHRHGSDITMDSLKRSLIEVMALFPVYRSYLPPGAEGEPDGEALREALDRAAEKNPSLRHELDFMGRILLRRFDEFLAGGSGSRASISYAASSSTPDR